jgi:hypothetical protein
MSEMSAERVPVPGQRIAQISFFAGMALIILATIHNVGFDGMTQADRLTLPSFLAETYARSGKFGVTVFLVSLGLTIMTTGLLIRHLCSRWRRQGGWVAPEHLAPTPQWSNSSTSAPVGSVVLDTQKYLDRDRKAWERWRTAGG